MPAPSGPFSARPAPAALSLPSLSDSAQLGLESGPGLGLGRGETKFAGGACGTPLSLPPARRAPRSAAAWGAPGVAPAGRPHATAAGPPPPTHAERRPRCPTAAEAAGQSGAPRRAARPALPGAAPPPPARRQDAALLVPRQGRVPLGQDGPADGGRRAQHAAVAEPEQPLRLLRGAGGVLPLHELAGGGGRRWGELRGARGRWAPDGHRAGGWRGEKERGGCRASAWAWSYWPGASYIERGKRARVVCVFFVVKRNGAVLTGSSLGLCGLVRASPVKVHWPCKCSLAVAAHRAAHTNPLSVKPSPSVERCSRPGGLLWDQDFTEQGGEMGWVLCVTGGRGGVRAIRKPVGLQVTVRNVVTEMYLYWGVTPNSPWDSTCVL